MAQTAYNIPYSRLHINFQRHKSHRNLHFHLRVKRMLPLLKLIGPFLVPTALLVAYTKHEASGKTTKNRKQI